MAILRTLFDETPVGRNWANYRAGCEPSVWMMRYHVALHRFDARRQTRNFHAWNGVAGLHKDSLSAKEEAIADQQWLAGIPKGMKGKKNPLTHLFRNEDPLGAPNLVKRIWHKAYLEASEKEGGLGLKKEALEGHQARGSYFDMPSVPGVAAFPWARAVWDKRRDSAFEQFWMAVEKLDDYLELELPKWREKMGETPKAWLARVDWDVFREEFWQEQIKAARKNKDSDWEDIAMSGSAAQRRFLAEEKIGSPSNYYAVLMGDGDNTGKWLAGEGPNNEWFDLIQDFHQRMSEGIARFSVKNSNLSQIVEDIGKSGDKQTYPFQGKIIYAGGEDILAILPADQAVDCAQALRDAFQEVMPHRSDKARFTYSIGIAIGHIKEPLQDMIEAAHSAETRAKNELDRNSLAITLFKRSGETIEWGCQFGAKNNEPSATLALLEFFKGSNRYRRKLDDPSFVPPISGKFPYRLAELLARYQTYATKDKLPDYSKPEPITPQLREIALREVEWTISQQCKNLAELEKRELIERCGACLAELEAQHRPLCDFYNLFAIEAFIGRQGE